MENTGNYYLINHLVLITGLTDRTIRSYISSGMLQGEKINGLWHFTQEQVEAFITHPSVRPSILAKNHSVIYDFLADDRKSEQEVCMILDLPGSKRQETAEYFCYRIGNEGFRNIRFAFEGFSKVPRVILKGNAAEVLSLINDFMKEHAVSASSD